jgi:hypothetical protein
MKQTVNKSMFMDAFKALRPDNFSYAGLSALFDYLESYEEELGEEIELDVIALCCEFREYPSAVEAAEECSGESFDEDNEDDEDDEDNEDDALEWLQDHTLALVVKGGGVIVQDF